MGMPAEAVPADTLVRLVRATAILACSSDPIHRSFALRTVTAAYELEGDAALPLAQATRVVLARLGNFPAMGTRRGVSAAIADLPVSLLAEELASAGDRTVTLPSGGSVTLTDFQHELWARLVAGGRAALAAPTSAGKSFVLQAFLQRLCLEEGPISVGYLVPTRALITQVSLALRAALAEHRTAVVTVPIERAETLPGRAVYVMTQERLHALLLSHRNLRLSTIVVDEAHTIAEGARGVLLQDVLERLISRRPDIQTLFASPGVSNLGVFGTALNLPGVAPVRTAEPTVGQNFLVATFVDPSVGHVRIKHVTPEGRSMEIGDTYLQLPSNSRTDKLAHSAFFLGRGATNLVYANGAADAEVIAMKLAALHLGREVTPEREELARVAMDAVHGSYVLAPCVRRGVAFHYANMPAQLRLAIERAVADGHVTDLVCTSTMLQGVNLPAKNVFMYRPEKGQNRPLDGVDFRNLAGRAGRLRREFQGNIVLIDYDDWHRKPLVSSKEAPIRPAYESGIIERHSKLLSVISAPEGAVRDDADLEAVFVRMLGQFREETLNGSLSRLQSSGELDADRLMALKAAVERAAGVITLPQEVLQRTPDISAHRQQALYQVLSRRIGPRPSEKSSLIPRHPDDEGAYESYALSLQLCHRVLLGLPRGSRFHRFVALVALWWMKGRGLPRIIQNQLNKKPEADGRKVIRDTLEFVEREVRYQSVRLLGCYDALLRHVLHERSAHGLAESLPEIPLLLEMGASTRTAVSLMSLGIGRPTAIELSENAPRNLDIEDAQVWLKSNTQLLRRLSPTAVLEVLEAMVTNPEARLNR
jgi:hypothetical protein